MPAAEAHAILDRPTVWPVVDRLAASARPRDAIRVVVVGPHLLSADAAPWPTDTPLPSGVVLAAVTDLATRRCAIVALVDVGPRWGAA